MSIAADARPTTRRLLGADPVERLATPGLEELVLLAERAGLTGRGPRRMLRAWRPPW